jgi:hypothetical protein
MDLKGKVNAAGLDWVREGAHTENGNNRETAIKY